MRNAKVLLGIACFLPFLAAGGRAVEPGGAGSLRPQLVWSQHFPGG